MMNLCYLRISMDSFRLNPELNKLNPSEVEFNKKDLKPLGWLMLRFFSITKFIRYREYKNTDDELMISTTNFTIINTVLCWCGPLHEETLTRILMLIQVCDLTRRIIINRFILDCLR
jgi:UDP-N-acetylglucosamine--dolichyl-phosphate N-acetylglucosaminephosphotransferase